MNKNDFPIIKDYPNYSYDDQKRIDEYYRVRVNNKCGLVCAQCNYIGLFATRPFYLKHESHLGILTEEEKRQAASKGNIYNIKY